MSMRDIIRAATETPTPTIVRPDLDEDVRARLRALPPYKVVVLDCQCHSFDDVERALCRIIPGMTRPKAHQHAWEIHTTGASVVAMGAETELLKSGGAGDYLFANRSNFHFSAVAPDRALRPRRPP